MSSITIYLLVLYFSPTIIAIYRRHNSVVAISLLNFFLGWTGIVWIVILIWSLNKSVSEKSYFTFLPDLKKTNSMKHACKCYMEELTDGERRVAVTLAGELSYKDYFLFNNITIHSKKHVSSQVDHIIVSKFGIFVVENKDYSGWIYGGENQAQWTQTFKTGKKSKFQNPLFQNYSHIMSLLELEPNLRGKIYSVVVFSGNAEMKTDMPKNVVHADDLVAYIKTFTTETISEEQVQFIIGKLSYACQTINISNEEHITNIQRSKSIQTPILNFS